MLAPHTPKQNDLPAVLPAADCERDRPKREARVGEWYAYAVATRQSERLLSGVTGIIDPLS